MLTFNDLLRIEKIDPTNVQLVRHIDTRFSKIMTPYELWRTDRKQFEKYQSQQGRKVFQVGGILASFVVTTSKDTLFVGLYKICGIGKVPKGRLCPLSNNDVGGEFLYDLVQISNMETYVGKLIIDWGIGFKSWVQRAKNKNKPIVEINRKITDPPFPGFHNFRCNTNKIEALPYNWQEVLRNSNGVYILICQDTGKQYVGSAYGEGGLWGRFLEYARTGHGGNIELRNRGKREYVAAVLQTLPSGLSSEEVIKIEYCWKEKLQTRLFGLNKN
jgi:hypothetical protein